MKFVLSARLWLCFLLSLPSVFVLAQPEAAKADTIHYPEEAHFRNVQQLTFGGDNAEAYWSYDGKSLVFQRTAVKDGIACDQIFYGKVPEQGAPFSYRLVSTGKGRTTCAFFTKDNKHIIYASTHEGGADCPPLPDRASTATATFGRCTAAMIFIWPISLAKL
jgi:hypothetical protein